MRVPKIFFGVAVLAILAILPVFLSSYYVGLMIVMLIFGIFAMSADILVGYGGLPTLGHAAFFGMASYTVGYLTLNVLNNFWLNLAAGIGLSLAVGGVFGLLALRARGVYFMMITLALAQVLWGVAFKWTSVTRGDDGLSGIPRPDLGFITLNLADTTAYYYFTLALFILATIAMYLVVKSPFGLALRGIRDSETRMRSLGYNIWLYQYVAFIIAGFFAALAGVLDVYYNGYVGPADLHLVTSARVLLMVILGGAGTLFGPVIGAFTIVILENFVSDYTSRWMMVLGFIYVLVIILAPQGIYGPITRRVEKWLGPRAP